ncbi:MAG: PQQ-dependent dehydrogenase, methanol/ethanol family, partial [Burkholderiaceae bacterium]|nr:PQQ-dependent dehydrogenase, methanol/ethanol family [Burkholderiaceae bacterium]
MAPTWAYSLNNPQSHESQPMIHNGVMFVTTHDSTVAIDPLTGRQIWKQTIEYKRDVFAMACCGLLNRGVGVYKGKVFRGTLDARIVAYDAAN